MQVVADGGEEKFTITTRQNRQNFTKTVSHGKSSGEPKENLRKQKEGRVWGEEKNRVSQ